LKGDIKNIDAINPQHFQWTYINLLLIIERFLTWNHFWRKINFNHYIYLWNPLIIQHIYYIFRKLILLITVFSSIRETVDGLIFFTNGLILWQGKKEKKRKKEGNWVKKERRLQGVPDRTLRIQIVTSTTPDDNEY
jgi:hypothetical protein